MTFPVVAPLNLLALATLIPPPESSVSAWAATPENFELDPTAPESSIIVSSCAKVPDIAVTPVRFISAVPPLRALISVLKVSTAAASPIVPERSISTTLLLFVKLSLVVINV